MISEISRSGKLKVPAENVFGRRCAAGCVCVSIVSIAANLKTTTASPTAILFRKNRSRKFRKKSAPNELKEKATFSGHYVTGACVRNFFPPLSRRSVTAIQSGLPLVPRATVINRKAPSEPRCRASATWRTTRRLWSRPRQMMEINSLRSLPLRRQRHILFRSLLALWRKPFH